MGKHTLLVGSVVLATLQCGCQHADPAQEAQARKDVASVQTYYTTHEIGGSWLVSDLHAIDGNVVGQVDMLGSPAQACAFKSDSSSSRENAISNACPREGDPVWSAIGPETDILLEVSCNHEAFYTHSCRDAHRMAEPGSVRAGETESLDGQAKQGDPLALSRLGVMYANGDEGKPYDPAKAVELYKLAAKQGFAAAQLNLAMMYEDGDGTRKNLVLAYGYYTLAHEHADAEKLESRMSSQDIRKAKAIADAWKEGSLLEDQLERKR